MISGAANGIKTGIETGIKTKSILLPVLLSITLALPVLPSLVSPGLSSGAATALEGTTAREGEENGPTITLSNKTPKQGEVVEVRVSHLASGSEAPPEVEVLGHKYKLFPDKADSGQESGPGYEALFAVPVVQRPGAYKITVGSASQSFTVRDAHFVVQRLSLPKSKDNFNTAPGEEEAVEKAKATVSAERMWSGKFDRPSHAHTSAPFGIRRIVNGKLLPDYFHSGLDFAAGMGSPIYATAPGTVVLAQGGGVFKLHGNMVAIDHGQGVVSFYIHMKKVLVKQGQVVKQGEEIGLVGQTGRANGPHLHFSIYVNQVASSPLQWFAGLGSAAPKP
jgi:murein DD-endopeptidase MepM/ murein hydrolase activator NlpD